MADNQQIIQQKMPFGDAFLVNTPEIDSVQKQLYQSQLQRQMYAQQQSRAMDNAMTREFAKIKSADIPEFMDAYEDYKNKKQNLLFNKQIQNNPKAYAQAQADANEALAKTMQIAQASAEEKQRLMGYQQKYNTSNGHYMFADDFSDKWKKAMDTPTSQLRNTDLATDEPFYDKGVQNFNFAAIDKAARGQLQPNGYEKVVPVGTDGIQEDRIVHKSYAPPAQYKAKLMAELQNGKGGKWAQAFLHNLPPEELAATHQAYLNATNQDWLEKTGKPQPQNVAPSNPNNDVDVLTSYIAEKNFLNTQPVVEPTRRLTDVGQRMAAQQKITQQNQANAARLGLGRSESFWNYQLANPKPKSEAPKNADDFVKYQVQDALGTPPTPIERSNGESVPLYTMKTSAAISNLFQRTVVQDGKQVKVAPTDFKVSPDGKTVYPVYETSATSSTGKSAIDPELTKPMTIEEYTAVLRKAKLGNAQPSTPAKQAVHNVDIHKLREKYQY